MAKIRQHVGFTFKLTEDGGDYQFGRQDLEISEIDTEVSLAQQVNDPSAPDEKPNPEMLYEYVRDKAYDQVKDILSG